MRRVAQNAVQPREAPYFARLQRRRQILGMGALAHGQQVGRTHGAAITLQITVGKQLLDRRRALRVLAVIQVAQQRVEDRASGGDGFEQLADRGRDPRLADIVDPSQHRRGCACRPRVLAPMQDVVDHRLVAGVVERRRSAELQKRGLGLEELAENGVRLIFRVGLQDRQPQALAGQLVAGQDPCQQRQCGRRLLCQQGAVGCIALVVVGLLTQLGHQLVDIALRRDGVCQQQHADQGCRASHAAGHFPGTGVPVPPLELPVRCGRARPRSVLGSFSLEDLGRTRGLFPAMPG